MGKGGRNGKREEGLGRERRKHTRVGEAERESYGVLGNESGPPEKRGVGCNHGEEYSGGL